VKILYGVQATGQGHISRARAMASALRAHDVEVTWLFSGRPRERLFDMEPFGQYLHRRGLSFSISAGAIDHLSTVFHNNIFVFLRDVRALDLSGYDLIVTDFEPVTAWAGRLQGKTTVGIGHQYAFGDDTPKSGDSWLSRAIMRYFAPVDVPLGLHWHPYAKDILPPILDLPPLEVAREDYTLVYLPFESQDEVTRWLNRYPAHSFIQYAAGLEQERRGNVTRFPAGIHSFKQHLYRARGVICNSGFELISECLQLGKPILTKPLRGQFEQLSNALALQQMGYARVIRSLDALALDQWLAAIPAAPDVHFPDVAEVLARWLAGNQPHATEGLGWLLWQQAGKGPGKPVAAREEAGGYPRGVRGTTGLSLH
jgi:uncharacterized protein (TIGR00661 family)